jgi:hypothetical protein
VRHNAIFHRRPNLSTPVLIFSAHQFSFIAGNRAPPLRNEAEHELGGPKKGARVIEKKCLTIRFLFA